MPVQQETAQPEGFNIALGKSGVIVTYRHIGYEPEDSISATVKITSNQLMQCIDNLLAGNDAQISNRSGIIRFIPLGNNRYTVNIIGQDRGANIYGLPVTLNRDYLDQLAKDTAGQSKN